jgi:hypothetical protein
MVVIREEIIRLKKCYLKYKKYKAKEEQRSCSQTITIS